jgi:cell division protein FtsL
MSNRSMITIVALLVMCSLLLVNSQYQARRLFIELERAQLRQKELETEWDQLQYEQSTLAKHSRIDGIARASLNMSVPGPGRTQYLMPGVR